MKQLTTEDQGLKLENCKPLKIGLILMGSVFFMFALPLLFLTVEGNYANQVFAKIIGLVFCVGGLIYTEAGLKSQGFSFGVLGIIDFISAFVNRNIRGYYMVHRWTRHEHSYQNDKQKYYNLGACESFYTTRNAAMSLVEVRYNNELIVVVPVGGWLAKPQMRCSWLSPLEEWGIKGYGRGESQSLFLVDNFGSKIPISPEMIAKFLNNSKELSLRYILKDLVDYYDRLSVSEDKRQCALSVLWQAETRIQNTKRFQHSKEGQEIREWLSVEIARLNA